MELDELRLDCARKQKKGLHFIAASVVIWLLVLVVELTALPLETKNLLVFCCTVPLMPLAWALSKVLGIDFSNSANPLTKLGMLFSFNQLLYILIVMWVFAAVPGKMLMVFAMVFGAHLLPFGWLYESRAYYVASVFIPVMALVVGHLLPLWALAAIMVFVEVVFTVCLASESRKLSKA